MDTLSGFSLMWLVTSGTEWCVYVHDNDSEPWVRV